MNIPQLRFPEFQGDWEKKRLGEVAKFYSGGTPLTSKREYFGGNIPFIRSGEINSDFTEQFITEEGLKNSSAKMVNIGDILYALYGATSGEVGISKINGAINQAVLCIKSNQNHYFVYSILKSEKENITKTYLQGGQGNLSAEIVKNIFISFPPLPEQIKIATFLAALDEKLQALKKKQILLAQYKKGVMQRIFANRRDDACIVFTDENGKDFPEWEVKKLGEVFYSEKGKGISKDKLIKDGKFECVLYGELYTKYSEVIFEVVSKTNEIDGVKSKKGDLLIPSSTTTTGIDLANVTALNKDDVLLGGDITVLRSEEKINNVFYAYYLSNHKKEEIASYAQGSTIVHLYYSHIKDMFIDLPSLSEQTKIANFLSALDEKINQTQTQIQKTETWKKGLLQKMFV